MSNNHQFEDAVEEEEDFSLISSLTLGPSITLPSLQPTLKDSKADQEISTSDEEAIFSAADDDDECTEDEDEEGFIEKDLDAVNCQDWETLAGGQSLYMNRITQDRLL